MWFILFVMCEADEKVWIHLVRPPSAANNVHGTYTWIDRYIQTHTKHFMVVGKRFNLTNKLWSIDRLTFDKTRVPFFRLNRTDFLPSGRVRAQEVKWSTQIRCQSSSSRLPPFAWSVGRGGSLTTIKTNADVNSTQEEKAMRCALVRAWKIGQQIVLQQSGAHCHMYN